MVLVDTGMDVAITARGCIAAMPLHNLENPDPGQSQPRTFADYSSELYRGAEKVASTIDFYTCAGARPFSSPLSTPHQTFPEQEIWHTIVEIAPRAGISGQTAKLYRRTVFRSCTRKKEKRHACNKRGKLQPNG